MNVQFTVNAGGQTFGPYNANIAAGTGDLLRPALVPAIPAGTVGSATITADGPVVAVVNDRGVAAERLRTPDDLCLLRLRQRGDEHPAGEGVQRRQHHRRAGAERGRRAGQDHAGLPLDRRPFPDDRDAQPGAAGPSVTAWGISNLPDNTWLVSSGIAANMANSVNGVVASSSEPLTVIANESSSAPNPSGQDTKNYEGFGQ